MGRACRKHGEKMNAYRVFVWQPEGKRPLGRPTHRWENNIKIDLREIGWGGMDWSGSGQGLVEGSWEQGNEFSVSISWIAAQLAASQEGLSSLDLVMRYYGYYYFSHFRIEYSNRVGSNPASYSGGPDFTSRPGDNYTEWGLYASPRALEANARKRISV
jgi:hypothetical protein